jgi:hypothetical protein
MGLLLVGILAFSVMSSGILRKSNQQLKEVRIEVSYAGPWEGVINSNGDVQEVSGFSDKTIRVLQPLSGKWDLSFYCEKMDGSMNSLRVTMKFEDGAILKKGFTMEPYGRMQLSVEID